MRLLEVLEEYLSVSLGRNAYAFPLGALAASIAAGLFGLGAAVSQVALSPGQIPPNAVSAGLALSHLVFGFVVMALAGTLAGELKSEATFHLSLPMRKEEYAVAWLAAAVWVPVALEIVAPLVPIAVLDPRLVTGVVVEPLIYRAVEDAFVFGTILWVSLLRRKGLVTVYGLGVILLLPMMVGLSLGAVGAFSGRRTWVTRVVGSALPATSSMIGVGPSGAWWVPALVSGLLAAGTQAGFVLWIGRRLEVT